MEHFEIRQKVETVEKSWLETIHRSLSHRVMEKTYQDLIASNPGKYFEFVRVTNAEEILAYSSEN